MPSDADTDAPRRSGKQVVQLMRITIVGTGYVGLVTGACFAEAGHEVLCVDNDVRKVEKLTRLIMPIFEDGLEPLVKRNTEAGRLRFSASIAEGAAFAEVIFIAVGTPPHLRGGPDMTYVEKVGREVAEHMIDYRLLVEKSTVPVNTSRQLKRTVMKYRRREYPFDIASNPEFLREGSAIEDFFHPDRIVVGVESDRAAQLLRQVYDPIVRKSGCPYLEMDIASAEMTKHACNSFLAMKISYINAVSRICELTGADIAKVAQGMGLDSRIGTQFLRAGVGYGGSCFPKDVDAFVRLAEEVGYGFDLLKEVQRINAMQREHLVGRLREELWVLQDKQIAILGLAFKPGTDDIRESPALYIVPELRDAKAKLTLWDPAAADKFRELYPDLTYAQSIEECIRNADAALVLTDWPQIAGLDVDAAKTAMKCPIIIDGRNVFDPVRMKAAGFTYHSIGRKHG